MKIRRFENYSGYEAFKMVKTLFQILTLLILVIVVGTVGFIFLEGLEPFEAFYFSIITITTVGYGDIIPVTPQGKVLSLFIIVIGAFLMFCILSILVSFLIEVKIKDVLGVIRMKKEIMEKHGHIIVAGSGTIGRNVVERFKREEADFVVIEKDTEEVAALIHDGIWTVLGDATTEKTLKDANVEGASGIIACLSGDSDNLICCMSAKDLNPDITIVSRVTRRENIKRFISVGVERVVLPEYVGGVKLAEAIIKPRLVDFLGGTGLVESIVELDDIPVSEYSLFVGKTLTEIEIPKKYNVVLAAIERNGELIVPPRGLEVVAAGDVLIAVGKKKDLKKLKNAGTRRKP